MTRASLAAALRAGPVVLDGGLATQLEAAGHDLSDDLWSARLLADAPEAIVDAHLAFLQAGASVITTASYQATVAGFQRHGHDHATAVWLIRRSVELANRAREAYQGDRPLWIAASVGPYGAALADGSEYRGDYGLSLAELVRFHRPRLQILADARPDVLALETVPDLREAQALLTALDGLPVPAWLSFTIDGELTRAGQPLAEAGAMVKRHPGIIAVGVNCSDPEDATRAIAVLAETSGKPVVSYPNSGEWWDAEARAWIGTATSTTYAVDEWLTDGARLVGGCCRVTPADIVGIAAAAKAWSAGTPIG